MTTLAAADAEAAFLKAHPRYAGTAALDELRAADFARLDATGHVYLDYTGAGLYADSQLDRAPRAAAGDGLRQPPLRQPDLVGDDGARRAVTRRRARVLPRLAGRVRRHLHAERDRSAAARRRGVSVPVRRPLPPHLRQPQLGQRHPRVRARTRRRDDVRPERRARAARRRQPPVAVPDGGRRRPPQPLRLSGAVELLGRPASARVDRAGARARLGRAPRRGRVRADEPPRPLPLASGLRRRSRSTRCSAGRPASAR